MRGNSVTVIIPVYGDLHKWRDLSRNAYESAIRQYDDLGMRFGNIKIAVFEGHDITECRNKALDIETEYIVFLDADDFLDRAYIFSMLKGTADIRVPSVHRHYENGHIDTDQKWYQPKDLMTGNYIVVSAMIRTSLFKQLGGFHDYESLEDWDLWLRAEESGATFEQIPEAILHVNKRIGSRNSNKSFNEILANAKQRRGIA